MLVYQRVNIFPILQNGHEWGHMKREIVYTGIPTFGQTHLPPKKNYDGSYDPIKSSENQLIQWPKSAGFPPETRFSWIISTSNIESLEIILIFHDVMRTWEGMRQHSARLDD